MPGSLCNNPDVNIVSWEEDAAIYHSNSVELTVMQLVIVMFNTIADNNMILKAAEVFYELFHFVS